MVIINVSFTQCIYRGLFKRSAATVEKLFLSGGYVVTINSEKPRKGSFVVTVDGINNPVIEMLGLVRPFTKLRELDIVSVINQHLKLSQSN